MSTALREGQLESILGALEEAVAAWDTVGRVVYTNAAARDMGLGTGEELELFDEAGLPFPASQLCALSGEKTLRSRSSAVAAGAPPGLPRPGHRRAAVLGGR